MALGSDLSRFTTSLNPGDHGFQVMLTSVMASEPRPTITERERSSFFKRELIPLLKGWSLSFAGWGLVAFVLGAKFSMDTGGPWLMGLRPGIRDWLPWAVMTPVIFRFVQRFPVDRHTWKLAIPIQILFCVIVI